MKECKVKRIEINSGYAKYKVEHLEKGYGVPLGNSLKRIMNVSFMGNGLIKVDTKVENKSEFENLVLELWVNSTINPDAMLQSATSKLREYLEPFENLSVKD